MSLWTGWPIYYFSLSILIFKGKRPSTVFQSLRLTSVIGCSTAIPRIDNASAFTFTFVFVCVYVHVYVYVYGGSVLWKITSDAGNRFRRKAISAVQLIAVQFKMVSMRSKMPICALSNLSKCSLDQCRDCTQNRHLNHTTITLCRTIWQTRWKWRKNKKSQTTDRSPICWIYYRSNVFQNVFRKQ